MTEHGGSGGAERAGLLAAGMDRLIDVAPSELPATLSAIGAEFSIAEISLYLADLQQTLLVPWGSPEGAAEHMEGSGAGRAFQRGEPVQAASGVWWLPVSDSGDRIGVIRLAAPDRNEFDVVAEGRELADLLGLLITSRRLRSDSPVLVCRRGEVSLAAELRWAMLPPTSMVAQGVCLAGHLEPAYEIAGDTFDYALNERELHLAVFDAMGHGMAASRLANLAVGSYRNSRRRGHDLPDIYLDLDRAVAAEFGDDVFVTAHLAKLDLGSGVLSVVNAGHPRPQLIRDGKAHAMDFSPATPIGMGFTSAEVGQIRLEPNDSILIVSDGVTEAHSAGGDLFSVERVGDLAVRALASGQSVSETVRRLIINVLEHRGTSLEDDATVLLLQWRPTNSRMPASSDHIAPKSAFNRR
jgi:serine phosphatase RsbU (regulator of sigma subunit)